MIKPYYEDVGAGITIYCVDAFYILPMIKVAVIITDPPFSERTHLGAKTNKGGARNGSALVDFDYMTDINFIRFCKLCLKVTSRWVVMTCDYRHLALTIDWEEHIRVGIWVKKSPMPQISGDRPAMGHEPVLILHNNGKKYWNGGGRSAVWTDTPHKGGLPTQKPINLIQRLVSDFTDNGELVCDPMMGTGTTLIA
jgi:site-specific DNA-methyltransferase (adenine-specific)